MKRKMVTESLSQPIFLRTKLVVPELKPTLVARPRLLELLAGAAPGCLTLVMAPAGFGKTTLLAQWAAHTPAKVAWLSLDEGDNDPARFWRYLGEALHRGAAPLSEVLRAHLTTLTSHNWEQILALLLNELAARGEPLAIVLDNYQRIHNELIQSSLSFFLRRQPAAVRLLIGTRTAPPLALARLCAQGRLQELRAADLRFRPAETAAFLGRSLPYKLPADELACLSQRLNGWAAGLQLAAHELAGRPTPARAGFSRNLDGTRPYLFAYLRDEVWRPQPEPVRQFLLQTACLPTLTPSLCEAVTGQEDAGLMLRQLADAELFVQRLDSGGHWFQYEPLFADMLRELLAAEAPALRPELEGRAAAWYAARGMGETETLRNRPVPECLTEREWQILCLIAEGLSNKQIAEDLYIAVGTVKGHVNHLLGKLSAQNRTEAVALARAQGLLAP